MEPTLQEQIAQALASSYTIEREPGGGGMSRLFLARDLALEQLENALREEDPFLYAASVSPWWYQSLRGEPRFQAIVARLNLDPRAFRP